MMATPNRMGAHTPGPWEVTATPGTPRVRPMRLTSYHAISPDGGPALAVLPNGRRDIQDANARLIAAAPDLLEALESIALAPCACIPPEIEGESTIVCHGCIARAAIAKAEG